jgi:hypothetical protein
MLTTITTTSRSSHFKIQMAIKRELLHGSNEVGDSVCHLNLFFIMKEATNMHFPELQDILLSKHCIR